VSDGEKTGNKRVLGGKGPPKKNAEAERVTKESPHGKKKKIFAPESMSGTRHDSPGNASHSKTEENAGKVLRGTGGWLGEKNENSSLCWEKSRSGFVQGRQIGHKGEKRGAEKKKKKGELLRGAG